MAKDTQLRDLRWLLRERLPELRVERGDRENRFDLIDASNGVPMAEAVTAAEIGCLVAGTMSLGQLRQPR